MEQTLGKRIAQCRKGLGMTQDQLADRLGVTAQAVSKWENDQSCPDITMLPKLSEIFGISADELLGIPARQEAMVPEVVETAREDAKDGVPEKQAEKHKAEFEFASDRKTTLGFALWVLLSGALLLVSTLLHWNVSLWDILWPTAILSFGIIGTVSGFSFFHLCCTLFGGFFLLCNLDLLPAGVDRSILLPVLLILFGLSLAVKAFRKPKEAVFSVNLEGKDPNTLSVCTEDREKGRFLCKASFGEEQYQVTVPVLRSGTAQIQFGEFTLDLTKCGVIADGCTLELSCGFGELTVLVPKTCRVSTRKTGCLSEVTVSGSPDPEATDTLLASCDTNFGEIEFRYI